MNLKKSIAFSMIFSLILSFSGSVSFTDSTLCTATADNHPTEGWLVPGGRSIGVTLATDGVLVVDVSDVVSASGKHFSPAKDAGLKAGDLIQSFNGSKTFTVDDLNKAISCSKGKDSTVVISRNGGLREILIKPQKSQSDGRFKIGAWVKDAASGIGTLTFYDPATNTFGALGHGICDPETGKILTIDNGSILDSSIVSVNKGEKGIPGELNGIFKDETETLGTITKNNSAGIFGTATSCPSENTDSIPIATRTEVKTGAAYILANVEGSKVEKFNIEILKIMPKAISVQKGMVIHITDKRLLDKTGGIVRGMSGSPIIQNGKLVGAVTHVFVNDPTRGYGIFIENMLAEAEKISK